MAARRAPSAFAVTYTAAVLGALVVVAWRPLAGLVVSLTAGTVGSVVALARAEKAQGDYRRRLEQKVAARPWCEAGVLADEEALIAARRARVDASMARSVHGQYADAMQFSAWSSRERAAMADDAGARRVVIDHHTPIEEAS